MEERRQFPRISHRFKLDVHPIGGEGTGRDVSKGGVSFVHDEKVEPGSVLELELRVPGLSGAYRVKGKVLRCLPEGEHYLIGINFIDVDPETEKGIAEVLQSFF